MDLFRLGILGTVGAVNIVLALVAYSRNKRSPANRAFAAAVFVIVCWLALDFMGDQALFAPYSLALKRSTLVLGMLMGTLLLYFALSFPQRTQELGTGWRVYFATGAGLMAATGLTDAMWRAQLVAESQTAMVPGPLLPLIALWAIAGVALMVLILVRKYRRAEPLLQAQLKYMLVGVTAFALASLLLGLVVPMLTGMYELAGLNTMSSLFLVGFTAYAMIRHRLMDVRLVVLRGAAYTVLLAVSAAIYVGIVALLRTQAASYLRVDPTVIFVLFGLIAAVGFQPIKRGLELWTDWLFFRNRYDPDALLRHLGITLSSTVDLEQLAQLLAKALHEELRLTFAAVAWDRRGTLDVARTNEHPTDVELAALLGLCERGNMLVADELEGVEDASRVLDESGVRVLVPFVVDSGVVGALLLGAKQSGEIFSAEDLRFLEILRPEAAVCMRNAQLFDEKNQRVRELTALNRLAFSVSGNTELDPILEGALEQVIAVTEADSGSVMLLDKNKRYLSIAAAQGIPKQVVDNTYLRMGEGIAGWVAQTREPLILVDDLDPRFHGELSRNEIISAITVPLIAKDAVIGVLSLNRTESHVFFSRQNLQIVSSFAGQLAVAIENAKLYRDLERTFLGTIGALAAAVDAKDPYTFGHSTQVTEHAVSTAYKLGLEETNIENVRIAAMLHDIGKIGVDGALLNKPGALLPEERADVNRHPTIGANILSSLDFLRDAVPLILFHHERYDGAGYPSGLSGDAIPIGARIIAVTDAYNAMVSDRPYRRALPVETALGELRGNAGTQFDPSVVKAFIEVLEEDSRPPAPVIPVPPVLRFKRVRN